MSLNVWEKPQLEVLHVNLTMKGDNKAAHS